MVRKQHCHYQHKHRLILRCKIHKYCYILETVVGDGVVVRISVVAEVVVAVVVGAILGVLGGGVIVV